MFSSPMYVDEIITDKLVFFLRGLRGNRWWRMGLAKEILLNMVLNQG